MLRVMKLGQDYERIFDNECFEQFELPDKLDFYFNGGIYQKFIDEYGETAAPEIAREFMDYYKTNVGE